jgi:hypothetical protein
LQSPGSAPTKKKKKKKKKSLIHTLRNLLQVVNQDNDKATLYPNAMRKLQNEGGEKEALKTRIFTDTDDSDSRKCSTK